MQQMIGSLTSWVHTTSDVMNVVAATWPRLKGVTRIQMLDEIQ